MKKVLFFFACLLLSRVAAAEAAPQVIKVGMVLPLSGGLAQTGADIKDGALLAVKEQKNPRYRLELLFEDSRYDPKTAVTAAQRLIDIEHVDVLFSLWDTADPIAPIAERKGVLHTAIRWNPHLTESHQLTFTFESTYRSWSIETLKLFQAAGIKTFVLLGLESQGWQLTGEYLKQHAPDYGLQMLDWITYQSGESDFRSLATLALKHKPDLVLITNYPPETELMQRRLKELNPQQKVSGYLEMLPDFREFDGALFVTQFDTEQWFLDRFKQHFGRPMYLRAQLAYDMMNVLLDTYGKFPRKPAALEVAAELKKLKNFPGASGQLNAVGQVIETKCVWKQVVNGKPVTVSATALRPSSPH